MAQAASELHHSDYSRVRVKLRGAVQGVGFRPFIYRLATGLGLAGFVGNSSQGVLIEVEGSRSQLDGFLAAIEREKPPRAFIQGLESSFLDPVGFSGFEIRASDETGAKTALVIPDIAVCPECIEEVFDPGDRRHLYPFTNCTNCGPRFTIIEALPYDRPNTTMRAFQMCERCQAEYEDPLDRRFHAQPNACPVCGPHLELWGTDGIRLSTHQVALLEAVDCIRRGGVVAVKGLGGFHLMVSAYDDDAVHRLRRRKHREEKPFALMYPDLESVEMDCEVGDAERRLLLSPECPIVLLRRRAGVPAGEVAPANPYLGVMLPYTPLHHLLTRLLRSPVVATSGNVADEPICTDEQEAVCRLTGIADLFLVHNRPIARHVDDSIVRVMMGREMVLRRARGYAPLPLQLLEPAPRILAVGAHLKNAVATSTGTDVFVSQHIGDLENAESLRVFEGVIAGFENLYDVRPVAVACDAHPDYLSTQFARRQPTLNVPVQHHFAHVLSCMAENEVTPPSLGVAWDGTGYGLDGTIWGGEFLSVPPGLTFHRAAHLRTFRLPGGERAIKEPRRSAIGLLYEVFGDSVFTMEQLAPLRAFTPGEVKVLGAMLAGALNSPVTSSAGRLFDAVAAILDIRQRVRFEGQAAMELEFALDGVAGDDYYDFDITRKDGVLVVDWGPLIHEILAELRADTPVSVISARFHNTLAETIVTVARSIGEHKVVLTGGCFQNKYLTERAVRRLRDEGFRPYWHQRVPPNDGGIALGQVAAAAESLRKGKD